MVYTPKSFIPHAVSLRQTFVHCAIFLVAATRRCRLRVSVTLWPVMLSHRLPVIGLVGYYSTNYLIGRRLLLKRNSLPRYLSVNGTMGYYPSFRRAIPHFRVDSYALLTRLPLSPCRSRDLVRLACLRHTASVHPEPGSNSQKNFHRSLVFEFLFNVGTRREI